MKAFIEEYGNVIVTTVIGILCLSMISIVASTQFDTVMVPATIADMQNSDLRTKPMPSITATNRKIRVGEAVNEMSGVHADDGSGGDITNKIMNYSTVDATTKGRYTIDYEVENNYGRKSYYRIYVIVD